MAVALSPDLSGRPRLGVLVAGACFGVIGLADDLWGIAVLARFGLQLASAVPVLAILFPGSGGSGLWSLALAAAILGWIVSYVNAFNFMDGIDGLSVAQVVIAGSAWALIGLDQDVNAIVAGGLILVAVALGFAPFNFPRAHVFLGDVGSYGLGALLAALAVVGVQAGIAPEAMLAPLAIYLADAGSTLALRAWRREKWYLPHCNHVYQRLVRQGWSHVRTTLTVTAWMAACAAAGAVSVAGSVSERAGGDALLAFLLATYLALPGWVGRWRSHRNQHPDCSEVMNDVTMP